MNKEETKKCPKCEVTKPLGEFYVSNGRRSSWCKGCIRKRAAEYRLENIQRFRLKNNNYRKDHLGDLKKYSREYYQIHRSEILAYQKEYREKNKKKIAEWQKQYRKRATAIKNAELRRKSISYKISARIANGMRTGIKRNKAGFHWERLVGYSLDDLKNHLESLFKDGMTWDSFLNGEIHIDHKIPKSAFNFSTPNDLDFGRCWALENLQPMWANENIAKRNKVNMDFQPSLQIAT